MRVFGGYDVSNVGLVRKATSERARWVEDKARGLNSVAMREEIGQGSFVP